MGHLYVLTRLATPHVSCYPFRPHPSMTMMSGKPQTFALRRNRTRPPMVLPAVCLAGIEPEPSSFSPSSRQLLCRVPLEDHQALHKDHEVLLSRGESSPRYEDDDSLSN